MRWDRTAWTSAAVYVAGSGVCATIALTNTHQLWRFEYARAADLCGEYLFFSAPILCAVAALHAQRLTALTAESASSFPNPLAGAHRSWRRFAALGAVLHLAILSVAAFVVWRSHGVESFSAQPYVRQLGLIVSASALGSLLGARVRSVALSGAIFGLGLLVALLIPGTHLRPFLLAGSGTFDFTYQKYSNRLIVLTVVAATAALLAATGLPHSTRPIRWARRSAAALLGVVAVVLLLPTSTFGLVDVSPSTSCMEQVPRVCGPTAMEVGTTEVGDIARSVRSAVPPDVAAVMPTSLELIRPGGVNPQGNGVEFQSFQLDDWASLVQSTIATLSGQNACLGQLPESEINNQVLGAAIVSGWIQLTTKNVVEGSFPSREVAMLRSLPEGQQIHVLISLCNQVWSCHGVDLGPLD